MRKAVNKKLSEHFTLYEIIEGKALHPAAIKLNWKWFVGEFNEAKFIELCEYMEGVRRWVNENYTSDVDVNKTISLVVNSGFRCRQWEWLRNRSGMSQHTIAAVDVVPGNVSRELAIEIMKAMADHYLIYHTGGFAISEPTANRLGFIHFDLRGWRARWTY